MLLLRIQAFNGGIGSASTVRSSAACHLGSRIVAISPRQLNHLVIDDDDCFVLPVITFAGAISLDRSHLLAFQPTVFGFAACSNGLLLLGVGGVDARVVACRTKSASYWEHW